MKKRARQTRNVIIRVEQDHCDTTLSCQITSPIWCAPLDVGVWPR